MNDILQKYEAALLEIQQLKQEIRNLKLQLNNNLVSENERVLTEQDLIESQPDRIVNPINHREPSTVHQYSSVEEKLALYRSYFRGREDVYPVRWSNKQGKSGYSPACRNEWTPVCQKPKVKCSVCTHQNFLPVTDEVLSRHLDAREDRSIGVYPMLPEETCWFLAMDFDKNNWKEDASAVMQVCTDHGVPAALERSRSGNGGHIWIFFAKPIAASRARRLGTIILTLTMKHRYQLGLASYDRLFPNQDTLPKGGFGNLIALPLQGGPRKNGNSTFVDSDFVPYEDQWRFLSGLCKMSEEEVSRFIQSNAMEDQFGADLLDSDGIEDTLPWDGATRLPVEQLKISLPATISIVLSDRLYIAKKYLSPNVLNRLMRLASFSNPDFYKTQAMRLSTYGKPRVISCA